MSRSFICALMFSGNRGLLGLILPFGIVPVTSVEVTCSEAILALSFSTLMVKCLMKIRQHYKCLVERQVRVVLVFCLICVRLLRQWCGL